jgi:hypothetical protein
VEPQPPAVSINGGIGAGNQQQLAASVGLPLSATEGEEEAMVTKTTTRTYLPSSQLWTSRRRVPRQAQQGDGRAGRRSRLVDLPSRGSGGDDPQQICRFRTSLLAQPSLRRRHRRLGRRRPRRPHAFSLDANQKRPRLPRPVREGCQVNIASEILPTLFPLDNDSIARQ